jgi:hypothetical protein
MFQNPQQRGFKMLSEDAKKLLLGIIPKLQDGSIALFLGAGLKD